MESLALTLVAVFTGIVVVPPLAKKISIPVIVAEVLFGIIIGKSLLNLVPEHQALEFFSLFGLIYLMFLGGLEVDFAKLSQPLIKRALTIVLASLAIPFLSGFLLASWADVNPLLMGTMFCTTSLGLALPLLKEMKTLRGLNRILFASVVIVDVLSLFLLAFILSNIQGLLTANFIYSTLVVIALFLLPILVRWRKWRRKITSKVFRENHFDMEFRVAFGLIFLLAAISGQLGFHAIIGGFIAGLIAAEVLPRSFLKEEKLHSFGYGFFIPLFFILIGAKVNIPAVFQDINNIALLIVIIVVALASKFAGVAVVSKAVGMTWRYSAIMGLFHAARLSLIIAAAEISLRLELITEELFGMLIIFAIVSATMVPMLSKRLAGVTGPSTKIKNNSNTATLKKTSS